MDAFTQGYIACALWSSHDESTPEGGEPLDANYSVSDIAPEAMEALTACCDEFQELHAALLARAYACPGYEPSRAGHDFWLTRNGHGAGFWDRDELKGGLGDELTNAAKQYPTCDLYVGDDKQIHV